MAEIIKATITNLSADIKTAKVINKLGDSAVTSVAGRVGDVVLTRYDVGLGNVNNTSDLNKPISTATQAALDLKSDVGHGHIFSEITGLGTAATADTGDFAPFLHQHTISQITDLNTGDFATSAQGALADTALQSGNNISLLNNDAGYLTSVSEHPIQSVNGQTGVVVLDADDIDDTSTVHKFATSDQLANADSALQSGDNISLLVNNIGYLTDAIQSGDNVSFLANDAGYVTDAVQSGDNISLLVNDENYVSSGDNISLFVNDSGYLNEAIQSGDNVSLLTNDSLYVTSGYITSNYQPLDPVLTNTTASFQIADETKLDYISVTQPVDLDAIEGASGDMLAAIYDPTNVSGDAFAMDNMVEGDNTKIFTSGERDKLSGIAAGAEVNVNADWDAVGGDAEILNKPAFGDITGSNISDFATSGQGALADTALQSGDNVSLLVNDTGYLLSGDNISLLTNDSGYINFPSVYSYTEETGNYNISTTDYTVNCISGAQTITLPTAVGIQGQVFVVKNSSTGVITITGTASQTIDGYDSIETDFPQSLTLQSTNTNWIII